MTSQRVALLVDGDNIPPLHGPRLLAEARKLGRTDIARVYGTAQVATQWRTTPGYRSIDTGGGKNATDIVLAIEAMELALTHGLDQFVLASSDGDFVHVALRLRESGRHVLGIGEAKTPEVFRAACSDFLLLEEPKPAALPPPIPEPGDAVPSALDQQIRQMIGIHSKEGKGMKIPALSAEMAKTHSTRISTYPERTWRAYFAARPSLFALDPRGPEAMVRFLPKGFAA